MTLRSFVCRLSNFDRRFKWRVQLLRPTDTVQCPWHLRGHLVSLSTRLHWTRVWRHYWYDLFNTIYIESDWLWALTFMPHYVKAWVGTTVLFFLPADACDSTPCQNNGTCVLTAQGSFTCTCDVQFTGIVCDLRTSNLHKHTIPRDSTVLSMLQLQLSW